MIGKTLVVTLEENAVFSKNLSPGNVYYSHDYIPGSVIWGHFASLCARKNQALFKKYFFSNKLVFTNLYPVLEDRYIAIPMPLSTYACKYKPGKTEISITTEKHGFNDYLIDDTGLDERCPVNNCNSKKKRYTNTFFYKRGPNYYTYSPSMCLDMHNHIDDSSQTTPVEGLYTYETLNKGQKFKGLILFDGTEEEFKEASNDILRPGFYSIGKGRNNGYGHAYFDFPHFEIISSDRRKFDLIQEDLCEPISLDNSPYFTITLLSDLILKDGFGNYLTSFDELILSKYLLFGMFKADDFRLIRRYSDCIEIDGFNMKHQRPKNKCIAIKKGSSFYFKYKGNQKDMLAEALKGLELKGSGERRNEGFGQIVINLKYHR